MNTYKLTFTSETKGYVGTRVVLALTPEEAVAKGAKQLGYEAEVGKAAHLSYLALTADDLLTVAVSQRAKSGRPETERTLQLIDRLAYGGKSF
jgi:hypothetical protein